MKKTLIPVALAIFVAVAFSCNNTGNTAVTENDGTQSALDIIFERKSVRTYADQPVEQEKVDLLVRAAMAAPTGMDRRPWEIIVVNDRDVLDRMSDGLAAAKMLKQAPMAIVVCGDTGRSSYWYLDCSAATQNLLLAAEAQGLGAVWTAAYPYEERMDVVVKALGLPDNILPLAVVPVGYPGGNETPKDKYDPAKVHYNGW